VGLFALLADELPDRGAASLGLLLGPFSNHLSILTQ
jgi:hypothetical protein